MRTRFSHDSFISIMNVNKFIQDYFFITLINKNFKVLLILLLLLNNGCLNMFSGNFKNLLSGMHTVGFHITAAIQRYLHQGNLHSDFNIFPQMQP